MKGVLERKTNPWVLLAVCGGLMSAVIRVNHQEQFLLERGSKSGGQNATGGGHPGVLAPEGQGPQDMPSDFSRSTVCVPTSSSDPVHDPTPSPDQALSTALGGMGGSYAGFNDEIRVLEAWYLSQLKEYGLTPGEELAVSALWLKRQAELDALTGEFWIEDVNRRAFREEIERRYDFAISESLDYSQRSKFEKWKAGRPVPVFSGEPGSRHPSMDGSGDQRIVILGDSIDTLPSSEVWTLQLSASDGSVWDRAGERMIVFGGD
jgi:hypothetical protein